VFLHTRRPDYSAQVQKEGAVLYTIAVILLILWLLGFLSGYTIGAFIHVLLVVALVLVLVQFLSSRRLV
jgi:asparagine N-glycosylation enzyme membrane subunit Stt3